MCHLRSFRHLQVSGLSSKPRPWQRRKLRRRQRQRHVRGSGRWRRWAQGGQRGLGLSGFTALSCFFGLHSHWLCSSRDISPSWLLGYRIIRICIRTWCCPVGTHSRPSSGQQPPQRCKATQLGTSCLAMVPMSSTVRGTTTSRGWQVARAYTSIHGTAFFWWPGTSGWESGACGEGALLKGWPWPWPCRWPWLCP